MSSEKKHCPKSHLEASGKDNKQGHFTLLKRNTSDHKSRSLIDYYLCFVPLLRKSTDYIFVECFKKKRRVCPKVQFELDFFPLCFY